MSQGQNDKHLIELLVQQTLLVRPSDKSKNLTVEELENYFEARNSHLASATAYSELDGCKSVLPVRFIQGINCFRFFLRTDLFLDIPANYHLGQVFGQLALKENCLQIPHFELMEIFELATGEKVSDELLLVNHKGQIFVVVTSDSSSAIEALRLRGIMAANSELAA